MLIAPIDIIMIMIIITPGLRGVSNWASVTTNMGELMNIIRHIRVIRKVSADFNYSDLFLRD